MASELQVDAIKHSGGTSALTIDSAGTVDFPVNNCITIFGLTTQTSVSSNQQATVTGWSKLNSQSNHGFKPIGATVNESSGYFTPTKLGIYKVEADIHMYNNNSTGARWVQLDLAFTPNGGSEIAGDVYNNIPYLQSDTTYNLANRQRFYNFNHANDKVRLRIAVSNSITLKASGASDFDTQIMFTWLAPPQS